MRGKGCNVITDQHVFFNEVNYRKMQMEETRLISEGWFECPNWLPAGIPGYQWEFPGQISAYMKPAPKIKHVLRYKFKPRWWLKIETKLWMRRCFPKRTPTEQTKQAKDRA